MEEERWRMMRIGGGKGNAGSTGRDHEAMAAAAWTIHLRFCRAINFGFPCLGASPPSASSVNRKVHHQISRASRLTSRYHHQPSHSLGSDNSSPPRCRLTTFEKTANGRRCGSVRRRMVSRSCPANASSDNAPMRIRSQTTIYNSKRLTYLLCDSGC